MPLYEYECVKCKRRFERIEKVAGPHLKKCPQCNARVERLMAPPAIQFKGSGWYVTDYAGKGAARPESGGKESTGKEPVKESTKESPKESRKGSSSSKDKS